MIKCVVQVIRDMEETEALEKSWLVGRGMDRWKEPIIVAKYMDMGMTANCTPCRLARMLTMPH